MRQRRTLFSLGLALGLGVLTACSDAASADGYGLTLVDLTLTSEAVSELRHGAYTETPVACDAEIAGERSRCQIRTAGATTRDDPKKNYDLELALDYAGSYRYRLSAMSGDPSGMRALLAWASFEIAGLPVPRVEPVAVWLNHEYLGLYLLLEPIDSDFFVARGDRVHALYKARDLLATLEGTDDVEAAFAQRVPEANHSDLRALIAEIDKAERGEPHQLDELVETSEVLRYMAGVQFINDWDGIHNNYYLARSVRTPRFSVLPWDLDQTFDTVLKPSDGELFDDNALMRFLYSAEYARYAAEIERFDDLVSPEIIAHWIDTFEATLGEAYRHDPFLEQESLHDQAESLRLRAERQHEAIAGQ